MVCVFCGYRTTVVNSRAKRRDNHIWRRRECLSCKAIFTTTEQTELSGAVAVKSAAKLVPFSRDRLFISIYESCKHRASALTDASALTQIVITEALEKASDGAIDRSDLARLAYTVLQRLDPVAATFYRAYHTATATS